MRAFGGKPLISLVDPGRVKPEALAQLELTGGRGPPYFATLDLERVPAPAGPLGVAGRDDARACHGGPETTGRLDDAAGDGREGSLTLKEARR